MNSTQRKEIRYLRRKAKRQNKTQDISFNNVFTFKNLWRSRCKSVKGVFWKASVQNYRNHSITNLAKTYKALYSNKFKSRGFREFTICERGKTREIKSIHISERVVQKCLCDYAITPLVTPHLIYDNGACIKNKGIHFSLYRAKKHLMRYYQQYGANGYVLTADFSKYFDNINHDILIEKYQKIIQDKQLFNLLRQLILDFKNGKGLGLGSQISQISALFYASELDNFIIYNQNFKFYARYMDDFYIICNSKTRLQKVLAQLKTLLPKLKINFNQKKTQIKNLKNGFT